MRSGGFILLISANEELCKRGEAGQGDLMAFKRRRYYVSFWGINLFCCPLRCIRPRLYLWSWNPAGRMGLVSGSCALCSLPLSLQAPCHPFCFLLLPSLFIVIFSWFCSPRCPGGVWGSFQEDAGSCWVLAQGEQLDSSLFPLFLIQPPLSETVKSDLGWSIHLAWKISANG